MVGRALSLRGGEALSNVITRGGSVECEELQQLENKVLHMLSNVQGNLLDDTELIAALANSKSKSHEVAKALKAAEETEKRIARSGELYLARAREAGRLGFIRTRARARVARAPRESRPHCVRSASPFG